MLDKTLLDCFYRGLELKNSRIVEHIFGDRMMSLPYRVVANLLDNKVETTEKAQKKYEWGKLLIHVEVLSK